MTRVVYSDPADLEVAARRPDLARYAESSRFALTWADVRHAEQIGRPYAVVPAEGIGPGMRLIDGEWLYSAAWL